MSGRCKANNVDFQEWPKSGNLRENMDKTLNSLKNTLKGKSGIVYAYVLTTVELGSHGDLIQTGSAPNFQGDLVTLCTCKHFMRTWRTPDDWKGVWIAGFTNFNILSSHRNYLFYLMQVQEAFESQRDLWNWLKPSARKAKSASLHRCGDVYEPSPDLKDPFDPLQYCTPISNHVHFKNNEWFNDINYSKAGKRPALLVGDPKYSFLWSRPVIYFNGGRFRTKKWDRLMDFINMLA